MSTSDKAAQVEVTEVKKKRGRPAKEDKSTPLGDYIAEEAKKYRASREDNKVVEKYYELVQGKKLLLCKKVKSGTVYRTMIGSTDDKKNGEQIRAFVAKVQKEGKLKARV